jgi:hypothetical protein
MNCVRGPALLARKAMPLASVSMVALAIASSDLRAQSAQSTRSPPPAGSAPQGQWSSWSEAGLTGHPATDPAIGLPPFGPFANLTPGVGWEAAIGFDYQLAQRSPYHISGQFRYGQNSGGSAPFSSTGIPLTLMTPSGSTTPAVVNASGSATLDKEDHWLVDFAVGSEFALGSGNAQAKLGIRAAEIASTANGLGAQAGTAYVTSTTTFPLTGNISFQSRSQLLGVGPRLGVDGSEPLGGSWAFDYLGGMAVLFGNRSLNATQTVYATTTAAGSLNSVTALSASSTVGVFNLDAQVGISYWFTRDFKLTASYRFDGYWNALTIIEPDGTLGQQNRFYYGPMLRGTVTF